MRSPRLHAALAFVALFFLSDFALPDSAPFSQQSSPPAQQDTSAWVYAQLQELTLEEKVGQLFVAWTGGHFRSVDASAYREIVDLVEDFKIGGIIFGPGDPLAQALLTNDLQRRTELPLLVSQDTEWGIGMRVERATSLPRAMAIGATRDPRYAYLAGYATAQEARALGVHQLYAPVADVNNNPENPIINVRSFSEVPTLVADMTAAFVRGAQSDGTIATAKHFPGHGDTNVDSHLGLPVLSFDRARLDTLEFIPFWSAMRAGVKSIMTGHLALPALEPDSTVPASLSPRITQGLLREEFNFEGLIVTDALDMQAVVDHFGPGEAAVRVIEAGADVVLMSTDPYAARDALLEAIEEGRLSEARIDRSLRRLLHAKAELGLDRERLIDLEAVPERVATREHEVLTKTITRESLTLLRNRNSLLPIMPPDRPHLLSVTLSDSDDSGVGNTFTSSLQRFATTADTLATHRLGADADSSDVARVLEQAADFDLVVVPAFLRVRAWSGEISLPEEHQAFLDRLIENGPPVVLISFGNPYMAGALDEQPAAYLAAYGSSSTSQQIAAEVLFGMSPALGALPVSIPDAYSYGEGIPFEQVAPREDFAEMVGMDARRLDRLDSLVHASVSDQAFPSAALAVGRNGVITKLKGYGYHTYRREDPVTPSSRFDLASLTKVVATTMALMKLHEAGELQLSDPVAGYLPAFGQNGKEEVTIRQLLTHTGGLIPFRPFHQIDSIRTREDVIQAIMAEKLEYEPGTETRYSDLGFITLGLVVEAASGRSLASYCREEIFEPLGMTRTGFREIGEPDPTIVPTERDTLFRGRLIQGEVHDETAYLLGGAAGHAGLFSTAEDLSRFAYMLANKGQIYGREFLQEETLELFTRRASMVEGSTRALGWDTPSDEGYSSAGEYFSRARSYGHTGFTGTSLWIDPEAELFTILLTNRVHPTRENRRILEVRPAVADLAYRAILGPPEPILPTPPEFSVSWESLQEILGTYEPPTDSTATDARRAARTALQR